MMKLYKSIYSLTVTILIYFSIFSVTESTKGDVSFLKESYSELKNIGFSAIVGGSSHYNWVLVILDELKNRGHNVSFITKDNGLSSSKSFPGINTVSIGPDLEFGDKNLVFTALEERDSDIKMKLEIATAIKNAWSNDYPAMVNFIKTNSIDIMLCDHFAEACVDASRELGIPFLVTSVLEMTEDSASPYVNVLGMTVDDFSTEYQSIYKRFKDYFIEPLQIFSAFKELFNEITILKNSFGVNTPLTPTEAWRDNIKLVNSFFGITPPRPMGSLVEQVGPIISRNYAPLTEDLKTYFEIHKKVVYVSFGQHATPSPRTIYLILTGLLENIESGEIDGVIWSLVHSQKSFPNFITTSSNTTYDISKLLDHSHPNIRFESWVPQIALLLHPSTHVFISHGGYGSCIESMYAGVRMLLFPSFADQFGNAMSLQRANLGFSVRTPIDQEELTSTMKRLVSDEDGKIKAALKRMQAIVQIHSRNGPKKGADIVEEVAFSHINGKIPHRYSASRRLPFIRAHNIDLYIILAIIIAVIMPATIYVLSKPIKSLIFGSKGLEKTKKLK